MQVIGAADNDIHCVKSLQIRSYFWSLFSCIRTNKEIYRVNTGKYGPEITPYLDTFHAVINILQSRMTEELISCQSFVNSFENSSEGNQLGFVNIRRGIFLVDYLSPLLFIIALTLLTIVLRRMKAAKDFQHPESYVSSRFSFITVCNSYYTTESSITKNEIGLSIWQNKDRLNRMI